MYENHIQNRCSMSLRLAIPGWNNMAAILPGSSFRLTYEHMVKEAYVVVIILSFLCCSTAAPV